MNRLKEKIRAIYHIIIDNEYIVFTATVKDRKLKSRAAIISDNASDIFLKASERVINEHKEEERQAKRLEESKLLIEEWINKQIRQHPNNLFRYKYYDGNLHIIKYPDGLNLAKEISALLDSFFDREFDDDILVLEESDDFFRIKEYDKSYIHNKQEQP